MGVMTMKMMSSTRQTSTSGAMLIAALSLSRPVSIAMSQILPWSEILGDAQRDAGGAPFDEVVDELGSRVGHLDLKALDLVQEDVEHPDREDRDDQARGRGDQGLRDAAGNRVDDADDRAEEADEHGDRADRGQAREPALEVGRDEQALALDRALGRLDHVVAHDATAAGLRVVLELEQTRRDDPRDVAVCVLLRGVDRSLEVVVLQERGDTPGERERLLAG